jgi:uncharacterized protein (DUF1015 family)
METCPANLSPILAFFPDRDGSVNASLESLMGAEPVLAFADEAGHEHELRCVVEPEVQTALSQALDPLALYIADGHHRYETALAYQHRQTPLPGERISALPCDFVLAAVMSGADPGMVIRPTHRMVTWEGGPEGAEVVSRAAGWFEVERLGGAGVEEALAALGSASSAAQFVTYAGQPGGFARLVLRDQDAMANSPHPPDSPLRSLPAAVFHHAIATRLLGSHRPTVSYTSHAEEAVRQVDTGAARLAGLLPAVSPAELMRAVDAGERMPPKSTYFWPKPLTGMVLRSLERF